MLPTNCNSLILVCKEQAILWDACRARACRSKKCLFTRAAKIFGTEDLASEEAKRYSSVAAMENDRGKLVNYGQQLKEQRLKQLSVSGKMKRNPVLAAVVSNP